MAGLARLETADAVHLLSSGTGQRFQLVGRLAGGETGAHEVLGPDGRRLVVKWHSDPEAQHLRRKAVVLADRLREPAEWPVPHQSRLEVGGYLFVIQEFLNGTPIRRLTHGLVDRLVDLHSGVLAWCKLKTTPAGLAR